MDLTTPIKLHFEDSGEWHSLPMWAEYFIDIGKQMAREDKSKSRVLTAIVVPTRAFGAAFVSLGMVITDAAARKALSQSAHFEMLFDLPAGTPVIYRSSNEVLRGILQSPEEDKGQIKLRVQVKPANAGRLTYIIDERGASNVHPADHSGILPKKQGSNSRYLNKFVEGLLGNADPVQFGGHSKIVCTLVGQRNSLEHEIRHTPLALHLNGHQHLDGQLQDVLRVNKFVPGQQSHRTALVAPGGEIPSSEIVDKTEIGVVYDGAAGFLKWGTLWSKCHQIVILDRTEPYFDDAICAINSRFSQNRANAEPPLPKGVALAGGEVLTFREAII